MMSDTPAGKAEKNAEAWICGAADVERALNSVHADRNEERHFTLEIPEGNMAFLHCSRQVIITSQMFFFVGGRRFPLINLVRSEIQPATRVIAFGEDE